MTIACCLNLGENPCFVVFDLEGRVLVLVVAAQQQHRLQMSLQDQMLTLICKHKAKQCQQSQRLQQCQRSRPPPPTLSQTRSASPCRDLSFCFRLASSCLLAGRRCSLLSRWTRLKRLLRLLVSRCASSRICTALQPRNLCPAFLRQVCLRLSNLE